MADILIDITRLLDRALQRRLPTGVDRVSLEYVAHFRGHAAALVRFGGRWVVLRLRDSRELFDSLIRQDKDLPMRIRYLVGKNYALHWRSPRAGSVLLNTGHSGLEQQEYILRVRRYGLRPLYFLHDLIPITHPEYCRPGEAEKHRRRLQAMLTTGLAVAVNSEGTASELVDYCKRHSLPVLPTAVALLAPGKLPAPRAARPLPDPYFVMLATIEPRKNHLLVLHVWRHLIETFGRNAPRLVLVGQRGWECEQVVDLLERCEALGGFVVEQADCDDATLATWLAHAQALLFPSFAEGYGMPLVEALLFGTPVIASNLPVFKELAGTIPEYLDPLDGLGWMSKIIDYANPHSEARRRQCERMADWQAPTWSGHFAVVDDLLERCLGAR